MSWFLRSYAVAGAALVALYAASAAFGWEAGASARASARIDPSVRQSPGGWRSWTFWHQGIHGGK